jgi:hypothetical protein
MDPLPEGPKILLKLMGLDNHTVTVSPEYGEFGLLVTAVVQPRFQQEVRTCRLKP